MNLFTLSAIVLGAFVILGAVDGLYLHLVRFRLHTREESRREHRVHTLRALLFVPALPLVFAGDTSGPWLWLGLAVLALDLVAVVLDVVLERGSRGFQGGLPRGELALHVALTGLHTLAIVLVLVALPVRRVGGPTDVHVEAASVSHFVAWTLVLPGATLVALLHVVLAVWPWHPRAAAA